MSSKILFFLTIILFSSISSFAQTDFITVWKSDNAGSSAANQVIFPGVGNYSIQWENASDPTINGTISGTGSLGNVNPVTITFPTAGTYRLKMQPVAPSTTIGISHTAPNNGDAKKLIFIEQWGTRAWRSSMFGAFSGCSGMDLTATDVPNFTNVTNLSSIFSGCSNLVANSSINNWDISRVTTLSQAFQGCAKFNQPINNWNTANVTSLLFTFEGCTVFNQPIGNWNVSKVATMSNTFQQAAAFNQPLNNWNVSNVTSMNSMFASAIAFNQPLDLWNTAKVTSMSQMFQAAAAFNQPLNTFNVSNVTQFWETFAGALSFNQPLDLWNTSKAINMQSMFRSAASFDQNIGMWNLSAVAAGTNQNSSMARMLDHSGLSCINYDATLTGWASAATTPANIFFGAAGRVYSNAAAVAARNTLATSKGWTITGDTYNPNCNPTLAVVFGTINAFVKDNQLQVQWQTLSETANAYFEVEKSDNGKDFVTIAKVNTKADGGNSDSLLNYQLAINLNQMVALLLPIGLCMFGFAGKRRLKTSMLALLVILTLGFAACQKSDVSSVGDRQQGFIRIKQVDIDGTYSYSRVVKINH